MSARPAATAASARTLTGDALISADLRLRARTLDTALMLISTGRVGDGVRHVESFVAQLRSICAEVDAGRPWRPVVNPERGA